MGVPCGLYNLLAEAAASNNDGGCCPGGAFLESGSRGMIDCYRIQKLFSLSTAYGRALWDSSKDR